MRTNYPTRIEKFQEKEVKVFEIDGKNYFLGEEIGACLGLADPRKGVRKIFERHMDELEEESCGVKMTPPSGEGGAQIIRVYSKAGCLMISMFAKTAPAKEVRRWLAHLPERVEKAGQQMQQGIKCLMEEEREKGRQEGTEMAFRFIEALVKAKLSMDEVSRLAYLRLQGLTQYEVAAVLNTKRDQIKYIEKCLKPLGLEIRPVRKGSREKEMVRAFFQHLTRAAAKTLVCKVLPLKK